MTVAEVYRALWRHKLLIAVLTAVWVGATWYATSRQTPTYEASTLVRIQQRVTNAGDASASLQASEQLARTYAQIIGSGALDGRVRSLAGGRISGRSEVHLSGRPLEDLALLWISARSDDAERARILANAAPVALRNFIRKSGTLRDEVVTVKPATTPTTPASPHTGQNVAIALLLGLIFNGALALLIEALRDRLPETEDLGQVVGYPVLATVPTLQLRSVTDVEGSGGDADRFNLPRPDGDAATIERDGLERLGQQ